MKHTIKKLIVLYCQHFQKQNIRINKKDLNLQSETKIIREVPIKQK